jgi:lycopene cyclase domain-containing protein
MSAYPLLALGVIAIPIIADIALRTKAFSDGRAWATFLVLLGLTLVFNSLLTGLPIVTYDASKMLGAHIGTIPLEDFSYTFLIAFLPTIILTAYERR